MINVGVHEPKVGMVSDNNYKNILSSLITSANKRILCSIFIIDVDPRRDKDLNVLSLLHELGDANWSGIDTRLLIGGSRNNLQIAESAQAARAVSSSLGIDTRWLSAKSTRGSHAKMVIIDNFILLGSHNWSGGAFTGQHQDSIVIESAGMAEYLANYFEKKWDRAGDF